jgi:hypothetical protein
VSCGETHQCPKESLFPAYVSYTDTGVDTLILRRFQRGSNFSQQIDSALLTLSNCHFSRVSDTITVFVTDTKNRFNDEYDWQLSNPFDQKTVSISEMKFKIEEQKSGGLFSMDPSACFSPLLSYERDSILVNPVPNTGNKYLFIHN